MNTAGAHFNFLSDDHRLMTDSARTLFGDLMASDMERRQQQKTRLDRATVAEALSALGLFGADSTDATMCSALVQVQIAREAGGACLAYPVLEALIAPVATGSGADPNAITSLPTFRPAPSDLPVLEGGRVTGVAQRVAFAEWANDVLLVARSRGQAALVRVPLQSSGIRLEPRASVEADYPLHDVHLQAATASGMQSATDDVLHVEQRIDLLAAAEMVGACRRMVTLTRDYLLARSQFGQVLGGNQALKHALADAHVRVESAASAIDYAGASFDASAADAAVCIAAAKLYAGRAGKLVAESMLQLHGAIGYTMEYPLHLLIRRVHRLANSYGTRNKLTDDLLQHFTACT